MGYDRWEEREFTGIISYFFCRYLEKSTIYKKKASVHISKRNFVYIDVNYSVHVIVFSYRRDEM